MAITLALPQQENRARQSGRIVFGFLISFSPLWFRFAPA